MLSRKSQHIRIFGAKIATCAFVVSKIAKYAYFCRENHNILTHLSQKSQHTRIQIVYIIEEFCTLLKKVYITLFCLNRNRSPAIIEMNTPYNWQMSRYKLFGIIFQVQGYFMWFKKSPQEAIDNVFRFKPRES